MSLTMAICCPSAGGHEAAVESWQAHADRVHQIVIDSTCEGEGAGYLQKAQLFYQTQAQDVLGYLHSDLIIHEKGWDKRVLAEFEDPSVAIVSFGGSKRHGTKEIYRVPYDFRQLGRSPFISNLTDAEKHGTRMEGATSVAVVDSMAIFVRRTFLDALDGWPVGSYPPSHCSDYWLCLSAHRAGKYIRAIGVSCTHKSGGVGLAGWDYAKWAATTKWGSADEMHRAGHRLIYDEFRDVLPVIIP